MSTIGRPAELTRLLDSLEQSEDADQIEFVLIDQTGDLASTRYIQSRKLPFPVITTTSPRGLSIGRNAGLALVSAPLVAFPDDDCWFPPTTIRQAIHYLDVHDHVAGVSAMQVTADGRKSMLRWYPKACWITRRNFYRTFIEPALFLRTEAVRQVNGFADDLGAGSTDGFLSGEGSDLVLKLLNSGHRLRYEPELKMVQDDPRDNVGEDFITKMAGYSQGQGRVFADHHLPIGLFGYLWFRKIVGSVVRQLRGDTILAAADRKYAVGMIVGYHRAKRRLTLRSVVRASGSNTTSDSDLG